MAFGAAAVRTVVRPAVVGAVVVVASRVGVLRIRWGRSPRRRTGCARFAFEEKQHAAHVISELARFDFVFPRLSNAADLAVDRPHCAIALAGKGNSRLAIPRNITQPRTRCRARRPSKLREQVSTAGRGAIHLPGRRRPDDRVVSQLFVAPPARTTMKSLEAVVKSAQALEILRDRQPAGRRIAVVERHRMVKVTKLRAAVTPGEPARQISAADPALQRRRRLIAQRFCQCDCGLQHAQRRPASTNSRI